MNDAFGTNSWQAGPESISSEESGLWAHEDRLVVRVGRIRPPCLCIKTAEPYEGPATIVRLEWLPRRVMWLLLLGAIGERIAKSLFAKSVLVALPVSQDWMRARKKKAIIGWAIVAAGIATLLAGPIIYIATLSPDNLKSSPMWIFYPIGAGVVTAILGGLFLLRCHKPIAKVHRVADDLIWLDQIHPGFLKAVPQWQDGRRNV